MMLPGDITAEELHAYIDGELEPARRRVVEQHLAADTQFAALVAAYRADKERLAALYGPLAARPLPIAWQVRIRRGRVASRPRILAAISAVAAAIIVVAGLYYRSIPAVEPQRDDIVADALSARSGQSIPARHIAMDAVGSPADRVLTTALAMRLRAPDLSGFGYRLKAINIFAAASRGSAAELRYKDARGGVLTLYLRHSSGAPSVDEFSRNGLRICVWQDELVGMVISGHVAAPLMQRLASLAYTDILS
jgi:anti-sigma factor RsiW